MQVCEPALKNVNLFTAKVRRKWVRAKHSSYILLKQVQHSKSRCWILICVNSNNARQTASNDVLLPEDLFVNKSPAILENWFKAVKELSYTTKLYGFPLKQIKKASFAHTLTQLSSSVNEKKPLMLLNCLTLFNGTQHNNRLAIIGTSSIRKFFLILVFNDQKLWHFAFARVFPAILLGVNENKNCFPTLLTFW